MVGCLAPADAVAGDRLGHTAVLRHGVVGMTKSHNDQRRYRRKVGGTLKGLQDHRKREKRRKKNRWQTDHYTRNPT